MNNKTICRLATSRRDFLTSTTLGATAVLIIPTRPAAQERKRPDPIDSALVKEFVIKGHGDFKRTDEMLQEHPGLLNVAYDWGGGDYESAIDGAGHVGNREIASFLVTKGARVSLFVAAMLGKIEVVRPILTAFPEQRHAKGPHGLGLLHHGTKGGQEAAEVLEYLRSIGAS